MGPLPFAFAFAFAPGNHWDSLQILFYFVLFLYLSLIYSCFLLALTCFVCCLMIAGRLLASVSVSLFVSVFLLLCLRKWQFTCEFSSWHCQHVTLIAISLSMRNTQIANQFLVQDRQREGGREMQKERKANSKRSTAASLWESSSHCHLS